MKMGKGRRIRLFRREHGWKKSTRNLIKILKNRCNIFAQKNKAKCYEVPSETQIPDSVWRRIAKWIRRHCKKLCVCTSAHRSESSNDVSEEKACACSPINVVVNSASIITLKKLPVCTTSDLSGSSSEAAPVPIVKFLDSKPSTSKDPFEGEEDSELSSLWYRIPTCYSDDDSSPEPTPRPFAKIVEQRLSLDYIERMDIEYAIIRSMDTEQCESPDFMETLPRPGDNKPKMSFFAGWDGPNPFIRLPGQTPPGSCTPSVWEGFTELRNSTTFFRPISPSSSSFGSGDSEVETNKIHEVDAISIERKEAGNANTEVEQLMDWLLKKVEKNIGEIGDTESDLMGANLVQEEDIAPRFDLAIVEEIVNADTIDPTIVDEVEEEDIEMVVAECMSWMLGEIEKRI
ncbi:uncharacterized protein LOC120331679 [Styela clava]